MKKNGKISLLLFQNQNATIFTVTAITVFLTRTTFWKITNLMKKENKFTFPPENEIKKVLQRGNKNNFRRVNIGLTPNATPIERIKYDLCKTILCYKHDKNLSTEGLAQQLGLSLIKTEYILYGHIDKFTFEELLGYVNNLSLSCQIKINLPYEREKATAKA
jgi:hypothetical protein